MGIISWIIFGLIVGVIAKFLMPGSDPGGIILTIILGIVGALVGGFIASSIGWGSITGFNIRSIVIAVLGSILLLVIYRLLRPGPRTPA
ncbi:MAG TPA: GlsB/YeaQ/YmgE family stress response membrane protein [Candidatus Limnocylindrales bacterium]|nr:GlsB/YeaQ/YmgE family stress response membrane protein [Candidatus Limnocylindrales bacterium]